VETAKEPTITTCVRTIASLEVINSRCSLNNLSLCLTKFVLHAWMELGSDCFFSRTFALQPTVRIQVLIENAVEIDVFVERPVCLCEVLQAVTSISKD